MQAIKIKYLPATNTKSSRLKAICEGGSLMESIDFSINIDEQEKKLAYKLANEKLNWNVKTLVGGSFNNETYFVITKLNK